MLISAAAEFSISYQTRTNIVLNNLKAFQKFDTQLIECVFNFSTANIKTTNSNNKNYICN